VKVTPAARDGLETGLEFTERRQAPYLQTRYGAKCRGPYPGPTANAGSDSLFWITNRLSARIIATTHLWLTIYYTYVATNSGCAANLYAAMVQLGSSLKMIAVICCGSGWSR
jgi:hypothetical protein